MESERCMYAYWSFFMSFFVLVSCGTWRILQKKKNLHKDKLKIFSSKLALTSQSRSFVSHQRLFYINLLSWHLAGAPQSLLWCQFFFQMSFCFNSFMESLFGKNKHFLGFVNNFFQATTSLNTRQFSILIFSTVRQHCIWQDTTNNLLFMGWISFAIAMLQWRIQINTVSHVIPSG